MPKSAYDDLMEAMQRRESSGAAARDAETERKKKEERERAEREAEERRRAAEKEDPTGARVRRGFTSMQEMRDAAARELKAKPYKDRKSEGGVRG